MKSAVAILAFILLASVSSAGEKVKHKLHMSLSDTFIVEETDLEIVGLLG